MLHSRTPRVAFLTTSNRETRQFLDQLAAPNSIVGTEFRW
jgi:hypothetical protein